MLLHCNCYAMILEGGFPSSQFQSSWRLGMERREREGEGEGCKGVSLGLFVVANH